MTKMKKIFALLFLFLATGFSSFAFASIDRFLVEVSSNPLMLNEATDLTVTAVDKNGALVKSFIWDALISVKWMDEGGYTLPNGWVVNFVASSQGKVKFHKWIIFKQVGKVTISAEDLFDEKLIGQLEVEVKDPNNAWTLKKVLIVSPTPAWVETNKNVNIIWSMKELPNSPLQVMIDGKLNTSSSTNANGEFSVFANDISKGDHTLMAQITNAAGSVIAKSDEINFNISDLANELYKSISVDPSTSVAEWDKMTITLTVAPEVSTVELLILGNSYFMEKVKSGIFEKKLKFNTANDNVQIDAKLTADGNTKTYPNIEKLKITKAKEWTKEDTNTGENKVLDVPVPTKEETQSNVKITSIKSIYDPSTKKYLVSWTSEGNPARYIILISSNKSSIKENPELIQTTTDKQILITPPSNKEYFLQVVWADETSNPVGEASSIITLAAPDEYKPTTPTCVVDAIKISDMLIAGTHYLVWNKVPGVDRYTIYQSDTPSNDIKSMSKVGDTVDNKFAFSFDEAATEPAYKYYSVQWACNNGDLTNVSSATKVQVWPRNIALYVCMIIWFMYSGFLLTKKQEII